MTTIMKMIWVMFRFRSNEPKGIDTLKAPKKVLKIINHSTDFENLLFFNLKN